MSPRRGYRGGAKRTTLASDITNVSTSLSGADFSTWAGISTNGPFAFVIDRGLSSEEKVLATTLAGNTISGMTRGYDGTAGVAHTAGANIEHIGTAVDDDEANALVNLADAKGDIVAATAADTWARLAVGTNDQVLTADSAQATGVKWAAVPADAAAIPKALVDAKGDIIVATTADTPARLAVGANATVLTADSAEATGVKWAAAAAAAFVGARVSKTATQSLTASTLTAITFDAETFDSDAFHDNVTNNTRLTVPSGKSGKYLVTAIIELATGASTDQLLRIELHKNGTKFASLDIASMNVNNEDHLHIVDVISAVATDYFEVKVIQFSGGAIDVNSTDTSFACVFLGA